MNTLPPTPTPTPTPTPVLPPPQQSLDLAMLPDLQARLRSTKKSALRVVVFSGAGMSAESGIPTFRSGNNGLWSAFNPAELATPSAWASESALVWAWYEWRRGLVMRAAPNAAHLAVARAQAHAKAQPAPKRRYSMSVVTQNVDDLHERAGVTDVMHLHGSLFAPRCSGCNAPHTFSAEPSVEAQSHLTPPACVECGRDVRPGVVWFGESLDQRIYCDAMEAMEACDLLIVVGTSGLVYPAASMVSLAPKGAVKVQINPDPAAQVRHGWWHLNYTAAERLPSVLALLELL